MIKMLNANAVARTAGGETLAIAVFDGPVFRNKKKMAMNIGTHAIGNGTYRLTMKTGHAINIPMPETRKYEPGKRGRFLIVLLPPRRVETNPATTVIPPKIDMPTAGLCSRKRK